MGGGETTVAAAPKGNRGRGRGPEVSVGDQSMLARLSNPESTDRRRPALFGVAIPKTRLRGSSTDLVPIISNPNEFPSAPWPCRFRPWPRPHLSGSLACRS
jgi:hypothetical protein